MRGHDLRPDYDDGFVMLARSNRHHRYSGPRISSFLKVKVCEQTLYGLPFRRLKTCSLYSASSCVIRRYMHVFHHLMIKGFTYQARSTFSPGQRSLALLHASQIGKKSIEGVVTKQKPKKHTQTPRISRRHTSSWHFNEAI